MVARRHPELEQSNDKFRQIVLPRINFAGITKCKIKCKIETKLSKYWSRYCKIEIDNIIPHLDSVCFVRKHFILIRLVHQVQLVKFVYLDLIFFGLNVNRTFFKACLVIGSGLDHNVRFYSWFDLSIYFKLYIYIYIFQFL